MMTTADQKIEEARQDLISAYRNILMVLDPETHGHEIFKRDYILDLHEISKSILILKDKL